ncbi:MAG: ABC transporter permease [Lachnospiraceae bacterium]|nr:ABC transporter permease [Lachnospiraceae bacterium]
MIRYLIKNNFKIMFRNGVNLLIYIIGPILISAVLASAFSALLESYESAGDFKAGYSIEEGSVLIPYMDALKEVAQDNGIYFTEYETGTPKEIIEEYGLGGFVEIKGDSYTVYESADEKVKGSTLEYLMTAFFNAIISGDTKDIKLSVMYPDHAPSVDSTDYYGIIYIAYFGWLSIICAAGLLSNEKKNRITERLCVSDLSSLKTYLSRLIPLVTSVLISLGISSLLNVFLLGVHWGNAALSALIVFVSILAASAFGLMLFELTQSMVAATFIAFAVVWTMGFIGGSFETYMLSSHPEALKNLMPIYHENRALVELSGMGHSDYAVGAIVYAGVLAVIFSVITVGSAEIKRRLR